MYTYIHMFKYLCMYIYIFIYLYIHTCICIYTHKLTYIFVDVQRIAIRRCDRVLHQGPHVHICI